MSDCWGEICGSEDVARWWAEELASTLRHCWTDPNPGATACLSCLLVSGQYEEILELLELDRYPMWHYRRFELIGSYGA